MANKKLKVELELETAKAKQQLSRVGDGTGNAPSAESAASDRLAKATELNSRQMLSLTKAFTGMAGGLAMSYAANYMRRGSTAEQVLTYGGAALAGASSGAMIGSMAGPVGTVVGGLVGGAASVGKTYLERDKQIKKAIEEFEASEEALAGDERFANKLKAASVSHWNLGELGDEYKFYLSLIQQIRESIRDSLDHGDLESAAKMGDALKRARSRKNAIYDLGEKLALDRPRQNVFDFQATDALQKVGGGFSRSREGFGFVTSISFTKFDRTNELLEDIRNNTGRKDLKWL